MPQRPWLASVTGGSGMPRSTFRRKAQPGRVPRNRCSPGTLAPLPESGHVGSCWSCCPGRSRSGDRSGRHLEGCPRSALGLQQALHEGQVFWAVPCVLRGGGQHGGHPWALSSLHILSREARLLWCASAQRLETAEIVVEISVRLSHS